MSERLIVKQWLPLPLEEVFSFFCDAHNLEKITPPWLKFKVLNQSTPDIQKGTLFDYKLKVRGIPLKWQSLILEWEKNKHFVDVQLKGPYKLWHHTHIFEPYKNGVLMTDKVYYKAPFHAISKFLVRRDVNQIFEYRTKKIKELFKL